MTKSSWIELTLQVKPDTIDALSEYLTDLGANAITLSSDNDSSLFELEPNEEKFWQKTKLTALFSHSTNKNKLLIAIKAFYHPSSLPNYQFDELFDQPWVEMWKDQFKPLLFNQICICPTWLSPPKQAKTTIFIDPGQAFGTGTHATTGLCLAWLSEQNLKNNALIDYGCGSGILGIAAAKLGCPQVTCVDTDPTAITVTLENSQHNQINVPQLIAVLPDALSPSPVDILIANILAKPLISLASHFANLIKPNGQLVLSGIIAEQQSSIIQHYETWFEFIGQEQQQEWLLLHGIRKMR